MGVFACCVSVSVYVYVCACVLCACVCVYLCVRDHFTVRARRRYVHNEPIVVDAARVGGFKVTRSPRVARPC
jgi:hypothetical protein